MIRDWLIPLGLDYNHGYAKAPVVNSEVSKKREALEKRLSNVQRFREAARIKAHRASILSTRLRKEAKEHGERLYRGLNERLQVLEAQGVTEGRYWAERRKQKADVDAELETYRQRVYRIEAKANQESNKHERYCREQRELLRTLEALTAHERVMYELDNRKDHIMTICKLALANLAMWVRDRFFPATYAHATWHRLLPFFQLPGRVQWGSDVVQVEVRPFNNRQLTRDLLAVCQRVNELRPRLPDGRRLILHASSSPFGLNPVVYYSLVEDVWLSQLVGNSIHRPETGKVILHTLKPLFPQPFPIQMIAVCSAGMMRREEKTAYIDYEELEQVR